MNDSGDSTDPRWLADALFEQVWTALPDGTLDWVNRRVAEYAGRTREQIIGQGWLDMVHPNDRRGVSEHWLHSLRTGEPYEVEFRLRRADDVYRWHLGRAEAIRDSEQRITAWYGTNTDIDSWRRADSLREAWPLVAPDERRSAQAETAHLIANGKITGAVSVYQDITRLRELEDQKDAFLGAAAHDLKSPLTSIHIFAQMLRRQIDRPQGVDPVRVTQYAIQIERSANNMARMIDELLDLTRLEMGQRLVLDRRPTDLLTIMRRAAEGIGEPDQVRIESVEIAVEGQWDASRLGRMASNLLENAVKYSPEHTAVHVRVACEEEADGTWAVLTVEDQGIGIPTKDLPLVFERFHRGGNVAQSINGTGIGLASVRQVVQLHGGTIDLSSQVGVGTRVTVRLPTTWKE